MAAVYVQRPPRVEAVFWDGTNDQTVIDLVGAQQFERTQPEWGVDWPAQYLDAHQSMMRPLYFNTWVLKNTASGYVTTSTEIAFPNEYDPA